MAVVLGPDDRGEVDSTARTWSPRLPQRRYVVRAFIPAPRVVLLMTVSPVAYQYAPRRAATALSGVRSQSQTPSVQFTPRRTPARSRKKTYSRAMSLSRSIATNFFASHMPRPAMLVWSSSGIGVQRIAAQPCRGPSAGSRSAASSSDRSLGNPSPPFGRRAAATAAPRFAPDAISRTDARVGDRHSQRSRDGGPSDYAQPNATCVGSVPR